MLKFRTPKADGCPQNKGPKIAKKYWKKGKSKHLFIRLWQEGADSINDLKPAH